MEDDDFPKTPFKRKKFANTHIELRKVRCLQCHEIMSWISYWSFDHICFYKLASYSYVILNNDDSDTFLIPPKKFHGWYHNCANCEGLFPFSQWKFKRIWYHSKCTGENKHFFENLRKVKITKYDGRHVVL